MIEQILNKNIIFEHFIIFCHIIVFFLYFKMVFYQLFNILDNVNFFFQIEMK